MRASGPGEPVRVRQQHDGVEYEDTHIWSSEGGRIRARMYLRFIHLINNPKETSQMRVEGGNLGSGTGQRSNSSNATRIGWDLSQG